MNKKTSAILRQGLAILLSLTLILGPCAPGIMPVFAVQAGVPELSSALETASAPELSSALETASALETDSALDTASAPDITTAPAPASASDAAPAAPASASDALFDEDGLLLDGTVMDDVMSEASPSDASAEESALEENTLKENALKDEIALKEEKIAAARATEVIFTVTFDYGKNIAYESYGKYYYLDGTRFVEADSLEEAQELAQDTIVYNVARGDSLGVQVPYVYRPVEIDGTAGKMVVWDSENGGTLDLGRTREYVPGADEVFHLRWREDLYKVTFDYGQKVVFERNGGYEFLCATGGTGIAATYEEAYERSATTESYYALQGSSLREYPLIFEEPVLICGEPRSISHWTSEGGDRLGHYQFYSYIPTEDIVFHAQWVTDYYKVTFDYGMKMVFEDYKTITYFSQNGVCYAEFMEDAERFADQSYTCYVAPGDCVNKDILYIDAANPMKIGGQMQGMTSWKSAAGETLAPDQTGAYVPSADVTFTAEWNSDYHKVTFDYGCLMSWVDDGMYYYMDGIGEVHTDYSQEGADALAVDAFTKYVLPGNPIGMDPEYPGPDALVEGVRQNVTGWKSGSGTEYALTGELASYVPTADETFTAQWDSDYIKVVVDYGAKMFWEDKDADEYKYIDRKGIVQSAGDHWTAESWAVEYYNLYFEPGQAGLTLPQIDWPVMVNGSPKILLRYQGSDGSKVRGGDYAAPTENIRYTPVWQDAYSVTFHENNGAADAKTVVKYAPAGEKVYLPSEYAFDFANGDKRIYCWSSDPNTEQSSPIFDQVLVVEQDTDLYAIWGDLVVLTMDAAGGYDHNRPGTEYVMPGRPVDLYDPSAEGYVFEAWYDVDTGEKIYGDWIAPTRNTNLIARYLPMVTVTVVDNFEGSTDEVRLQFKEGWECKFDEDAFYYFWSHDDAKLLGYSRNKNATEPEIRVGDRFYPTDGAVYYGVWTGSHELHLNFTQGTYLYKEAGYAGSRVTLEGYTGENLLSIIDSWVEGNTILFLDDNMVFDCWCYDLDCTQPVGASDAITKNLTVYARWKEGYSVTFDAGDAGIKFYRDYQLYYDADDVLNFYTEPGKALEVPHILLTSDTPFALLGFNVNGTFMESLEGFVPQSDVTIVPVIETEDLVRVAFHELEMGGGLFCIMPDGPAFHSPMFDEYYYYVPRGEGLNLGAVDIPKFTGFYNNDAIGYFKGWTDIPGGYCGGTGVVGGGGTIVSSRSAESAGIRASYAGGSTGSAGVPEPLDLSTLTFSEDTDLYPIVTDTVNVYLVLDKKSERLVEGDIEKEYFQRVNYIADNCIEVWMSEGEPMSYPADSSMKNGDRTFAGWYWNSDFTGEPIHIPDSGIIPEAGMVLFAKWTYGIPVTSVRINTSAKAMLPGATFKLAAWPQPSNATNKAVIWTSSDPSVATVDSSGFVTAVKAGTAVVTVTTVDGGFTADCTIMVRVPVTGVKINVTSGEKTMLPGATFKLAAWPQPSNATNKAVTWTSSDPSVATVDSSGLVTAVKAGTAVVTVTTADGGFTADCTITVRVPVTGVKINVTSGEKTMDVGKTFQLAAWPQPSTATNKAVTWSSSDPSVATVNSSGLVTAVKAGTAVITVTTADGGFTATCNITAKTPTVPVTSVKINSTAKTLDAGKTFQLAAWPQPTNATNKTVTWSSSNPAVATVNSSGLVTAVKAGSATVTVKTVDGGYTATCKVTVKSTTPATVAVTSVKINTTAKTLSAGGTFQLAAWPQPTNATNKTVTWSSSNSAVAKVSSSGLVTAVKAGSATITVKTVDGGYTATCKVTVKSTTPATVAVTSVKINTTAKTLSAGGTFQLAAWPQPTNATNKAVTWTSSNPAVAKVSSSGLVTAVKAGSATITVKTADGGKTAKCTITVK